MAAATSSSSHWECRSTPPPIRERPRTAGSTTAETSSVADGRGQARRRRLLPTRSAHAVLREPSRRDETLDIPDADITIADPRDERADVVSQNIEPVAEVDAQGRLPASTVDGILRRRGAVTTIDVRGAALTAAARHQQPQRVVGAYIEAVANPDPYAYYDEGGLRGFLLRNGTYTPIDFPGGDGTKVSGINDRGDVVGYYDTQDTRRGIPAAQRAVHRARRPWRVDHTAEGIDNRGPRRRRLPRSQRHQRTRLHLGGRPLHDDRRSRRQDRHRRRTRSTTAATS